MGPHPVINGEFPQLCLPAEAIGCQPGGSAIFFQRRYSRPKSLEKAHVYQHVMLSLCVYTGWWYTYPSEKI